jgi:hypothetical protein
MKVVLRLLGLALIFAVFGFILFYGLSGGQEDQVFSTLDPKSSNYKDSIERLDAASQTLVTIVLAVLGGIGILVLKSRQSFYTYALSTAVFLASVISLYSAVKFNVFAAMSISSAEGDLLGLATILNRQTITALAAGIGLAVLFAARGVIYDEEE